MNFYGTSSIGESMMFFFCLSVTFDSFQIKNNNIKIFRGLKQFSRLTEHYKVIVFLCLITLIETESLHIFSHCLFMLMQYMVILNIFLILNTFHWSLKAYHRNGDRLWFRQVDKYMLSSIKKDIPIRSIKL